MPVLFPFADRDTEGSLVTLFKICNLCTLALTFPFLSLFFSISFVTMKYAMHFFFLVTFIICLLLPDEGFLRMRILFASFTCAFLA